MPKRVRQSVRVWSESVRVWSGGAGWSLTFKYEGRGAQIDLKLEGGDQAIRVGLSMAGLLLGEQIQKRLGADSLPEGLLEEGLMVSGIQSGAPLAEFEGKFLRVRRVAKVSGLITSVHVQWRD